MSSIDNTVRITKLFSVTIPREESSVLKSEINPEIHQKYKLIVSHHAPCVSKHVWYVQNVMNK